MADSDVTDDGDVVPDESPHSASHPEIYSVTDLATLVGLGAVHDEDSLTFFLRVTAVEPAAELTALLVDLPEEWVICAARASDASDARWLVALVGFSEAVEDVLLGNPVVPAEVKATIERSGSRRRRWRLTTTCSCCSWR